MTQALIVLASTIAALMFVDPFFGGALTKSTVARVILLVLGYGSLVFHCVGRAAVAPERFQVSLRETLAAWWPLIVLALYVLAGSLYARLATDVRENFLSMGLGMLFLPLFALSVRSADDPMGFMKALAVVYVVAVLGSFGVLISGLYVFHEKMWLVVPLGVYFVCGARASLWRMVLGLLLIGLCLFSIKNTTFLIVLATLMGCLAVWLPRILGGSNPIAVLLGLLIIVPAGLATGGALVWAWWKNRELLPSGNVEYRTEMYRIAWRQFLDSPIWGSGFTESSVTYFTLYRVDVATQWLPTHSDVLDLMSHGGAIAFGLWLLMMWRLLCMSWDTLRVLTRRDEGVDLRPWQWMAVLAMIQIGSVITYCFNPVLISPVHAYWIWGSLGVMWALHRELTAPPLPVRQTYSAQLQRTVLQ